MGKEAVFLTAACYTDPDTGDTTADGQWSFDTDNIYLDPTPPDLMTVRWEHSDYDFQSGTEYTTGYRTSHRETNFDDVSFTIDDGYVHNDDPFYGGGGIYLDATNTDIDNRKIIVDFMHSWGSGAGYIDDYSFGGGALSLSLVGDQQWNSPVQAFDDDNYTL